MVLLSQEYRNYAWKSLMSKTTQENPAVENSAEENVSNTSKAASTTRKTAGTTSKAASTTPKTTRTRATTRSPKSTASSTSTKAAPTKTTKPSVQQDKTMSQNTVRRVAIIGGNRIPFARSNGAYFTASNIDMFTAALNGLVERFNLQGQRLGEVVAGALNIAKTGKDRLKALSKINVKDLMDAPKNGEPRTGLSMGDHQAITALEWGIAREDQDALAASSHQKMAKAYEEGFFDDLITPFLGLSRDNNLRADSTAEKLAKLKPVFGKGEAATMTAGNSTPLTDGASCVLLASEEWAKANGHEVLAYLTFSETAAVDFVGKKEGLLMAPAYAVPRMLERAGLKLQDFDYYEIHEAFASQVLSTLKAWEDEKFCKERLGLDAPLGSIDRSKLNVKGSSLAAGHPFAATGGRIIATAAKILNQKGSGRILVSICAAGGQGVTAIIEK
ncbi:UNVERIFIED_CONTAM: fadI [Trichonephila clavipes]